MTWYNAYYNRSVAETPFVATPPLQQISAGHGHILGVVATVFIATLSEPNPTPRTPQDLLGISHGPGQ